jgi:hypothetical protein
MGFISILISQDYATASRLSDQWFEANLPIPICLDESPYLVCRQDASYRTTNVAEAHASGKSVQYSVQYDKPTER